MVKKQGWGSRGEVLCTLACGAQHYLRGKLRQDLETEQEEVEDTTLNCWETSFRFLVVLAKFEGRPLLQKHRLVNECFAKEL